MSETFLHVTLDTMWVLVSAFLVFFMAIGFSMLEAGLCRAKNTVNILAKNFIIGAIATLSYYLIGFGIMFGDGNAVLGTHGLFALTGADNSPATNSAYQGLYSSLAWTGVPLAAKFLFQVMFCGTAASIISGAVAERIKFLSFIVFSVIVTSVLYPMVGHWVWGGGFLQQLGFVDFAGSTAVHSVGGWAALAGILLLGSRVGKFKSDGSVRPIYGHNLTIASLGTLALWFGWFGFNAGSTMAANPAAIAHIAFTTNISAATATLFATGFAWLLLGKPDLSMILNGALAGLVAITAGCAFVDYSSAIVIGAIAGCLVVLSVLFFDKLHIDDPVGALSVHLVGGIFGSLAVGLFADKAMMAAIGTDVAAVKDGLFFGGGFHQLGVQALGVLCVGVFIFGASLLIWGIIKLSMGIRVSREEELRGLDIGEHGMEAYSGFQIFTDH